MGDSASDLAAKYPAIKVPSLATLKKYGITVEEWLAILDRQVGVCYVCRKVPSTGRLCTDHEHVKGWKKMPPEQRKLYVRGLLCFFCNHYYVGRAITVAKAANVHRYLVEYEARLSEALTPSVSVATAN